MSKAKIADFDFKAASNGLLLLQKLVDATTDRLMPEQRGKLEFCSTEVLIYNLFNSGLPFSYKAYKEVFEVLSIRDGTKVIEIPAKATLKLPKAQPVKISKNKSDWPEYETQTTFFQPKIKVGRRKVADLANNPVLKEFIEQINEPKKAKPSDWEYFRVVANTTHRITLLSKIGAAYKLSNVPYDDFAKVYNASPKDFIEIDKQAFEQYLNGESMPIPIAMGRKGAGQTHAKLPIGKISERRVPRFIDSFHECYYCGDAYNSINKTKLRTKDHIQPISKGGTNRIENIVFCCHECNNKKSNTTLEEFRENISEKAEKAKTGPYAKRFAKMILILDSRIKAIKEQRKQ